MSLTLVTGGTRSGKSRRAELLAAAGRRPVRYVATADPSDSAMAERIAAHRARRPSGWRTVEAGHDLQSALAGGARECVLIDGIGVWIAGRMQAGGAFESDGDAWLARIRAQVLDAVDRVAAAAQDGRELIVVAEQAGLGLLPGDRASRAWLDLLGDASERLAARADVVELVVAGRPFPLRRDISAAPQERHHGDRDVQAGDADHAVNVLSSGPPDWLQDVLANALALDARRYPDERAAIKALAALHGRRADEVLPLNGATEGLWLLPGAFRPALAACIHPAFAEGEAALRAHGVPVLRVQRDCASGFALDPAAVPEDADLVIAGNPASPSGTLDPAAALLALRRPGRVVVVDEAFMDLVPGEPGSLTRESLDDVVVLRSVTKSLSIPGLRAGYALAAQPLADRLRAVRPPWSANALALAALEALADRPEATAAAAERARAEREDLEARIAAIDAVEAWPASANFILVRVPDGRQVVAALRARRIAVRSAASFPGLGPDFIRLTARTPEQNARLAEALADAVEAGAAVTA
jgi:histidinol-phosphate/aromatic aminotransferase/cobyric acid decarboxylase-like protein/adenosyl cobinamide kinase/adenosyl cobinamide phosphate guanylyltransferase